MHTTIYKMGKPQGPSVEHRELYSNIVIIYNMEKNLKNHTYIYMYICIHTHKAESFCYTSETDTL